jgi:hypothetical protein
MYLFQENVKLKSDYGQILADSKKLCLDNCALVNLINKLYDDIDGLKHSIEKDKQTEKEKVEVEDKALKSLQEKNIELEAEVTRVCEKNTAFEKVPTLFLISPSPFYRFIIIL